MMVITEIMIKQMAITNDAAGWSPYIAGPQTAYRLDRHLEKRHAYGFILQKCSVSIMSALSSSNFAGSPRDQKHHCSEFCKVAENFLFTFDSVQGPRTEAIFTCEYISSLLSVWFLIMYTVYWVCCINPFITFHWVWDCLGWWGSVGLICCWGHLVGMDSEGQKPCRKIITFFDSNTSPNLC